MSLPAARAAIAKSYPALWGVALFSAVVNILVLTGSLYMLQVYDRILPSRSIPTLVGITLLLVILYAAYGVLDFARTRILSRIGLNIDRHLRTRVMHAVFLVPIRTNQRTETLQPIGDLDQIRAFMSGLGPTALFDLPWMPFYMGVIYLLHPMLGMFAIASAIVLVSLTMLTEARTSAPTRQASQSGARRQAYGDSAQRNAEIIQAMGLRDRMLARWEAINERYLVDQLAITDTATGIGTVSKVLRLLLQSGILGLGAYLVIKDELSAGALIAASIILSRALAPIEIAIANWKGFVGFRQSVRRLDKLLDALPQSPSPLTLPRPSKSLEATDLSVAPPGNTLPIVSGTSFKLHAGDGLGIIGPSAAGKSTLARALVGVWIPLAKGGSVRLDGATFDQWAPEVIGRDIGYLPQDIELFEGTIAENIARLDPEAPSDAIVAAATLAGIHDLIVHLPDGYQTHIGDNGLKLSAGQRQRVGLARALYGNPFLVVLDEPNSNLDAEGDMALVQAIKSVRQRGGIVVVVTHRRPVLAALDTVLALAKGRVQSFGPRDEVLKGILQRSPAQRAVSPLQTMNAAPDLKVVAEGGTPA